MTSTIHQRELSTARAIHEFSGRILQLLAEHFGGDATLNHLRIGSYIGQQTLYEPKPTSNAEIAQALGISRPSVTRIVAELQENRWVQEAPHPDDGRKRLLYIARSHPEANQFERALRHELNEMLRRFAAGEICIVDPDKSVLAGDED